MEIRKAKYGKYGEVIVLETEGPVTKIQTDPNDEFSYFWVANDKLKFPKAPAAPDTGRVHAAEDHGDVIAQALGSAKPTLLATFTEAVTWVSKHVAHIEGRVRPEDFDKFAYQLRAANGQEFTPLMDGIHELSGNNWGTTLAVYLDEPIPENLFEDVVAMQRRCGIRAFEEPSQRRRVLYCNELVWELLQSGHKIGAKA